MNCQIGMSGRSRQVLAVLGCAVLLAMLAALIPASGTTSPPAPSVVGKAQCGAGDRVEPVLQGQVPFNERAAGFKGYNCNLHMTAATRSSRGEGLGQMFGFVHDHAGHLCGYGAPAYFTGKSGTVVVDLTDPNHSQETGFIDTPGLSAPGEGIRTHAGRGLLVAAYYNNTPDDPANADFKKDAAGDDVTHGFDVYDVGTDCRHPKLLYSTTNITFPTAGVTTAGSGTDRIWGHEGALSPDGNTYWVGDLAHGAYHAIDISDPKHPKYVAGFSTPAFMKKIATSHGLSISDDGNRAYVTTIAGWTPGPADIAPASGEFHDGFLILDISEVQARKANPKIRVLSETNWHDGAWAQMTIPIKIGGKPYLVTTNEAGVGLAQRDGIKAACGLKRTPFGMVRIFDISDEHNPILAKNLVLEVNDPKNCTLIDPEISAMRPAGDAGGGSLFLYDAHMCTVDNRDNATTLACSYFNSGIRVYDIRDPKNAKEIAYFTPPAKAAGSIGWCPALPFLNAATGMLYSTCADTGVLSLKFTKGVWPFPGSTTPLDRQL